MASLPTSTTAARNVATRRSAPKQRETKKVTSGRILAITSVHTVVTKHFYETSHAVQSATPALLRITGPRYSNENDKQQWSKSDLEGMRPRTGRKESRRDDGKSLHKRRQPRKRNRGQGWFAREPLFRLKESRRGRASTSSTGHGSMLVTGRPVEAQSVSQSA